ncbi:hypothetical protein GF318_01945 [Candidatus Micrarchaeota archaeon]|nr:hypothetical protein [Candidatus Micrarchaeota archaeon]
MKFLFDEMLKRLSNWCRVFGIDSEYHKGMEDSELLGHAKENNLVFVTRDVQLAERCRKHSVECVFIKSNRVEEQVARLVRESGVEMTFPEKMRCTACNGVLEPVETKKARGKIPEDVYSQGKKAWKCSNCGKYYWQGGHWKNIKKMHEKVISALE